MVLTAEHIAHERAQVGIVFDHQQVRRIGGGRLCRLLDLEAMAPEVGKKSLASGLLLIALLAAGLHPALAEAVVRYDRSRMCMFLDVRRGK